MDYNEYEEKNRKLTNIFQNIGSEYGYKTVNAEYLAVREFKVRWQRSYDWIDFRVSDYLEDAPKEVLEGLAKNLFDRIAGKGSDFSTTLKEWVTRPEFCEQKQKIFLERSQHILNTVEGEHKNLYDSLKRLQEADLVGEIPGLYLSWRETNGDLKAGRCSVLMKVITINKKLDSGDIPDFVLDYCLYNELIHIIVGYQPDGNYERNGDSEVLKNFTQDFEAELCLKKLGMYA